MTIIHLVFTNKLFPVAMHCGNMALSTRGSTTYYRLSTRVAEIIPYQLVYSERRSTCSACLMLKSINYPARLAKAENTIKLWRLQGLKPILLIENDALIDE